IQKPLAPADLLADIRALRTRSAETRARAAAARARSAVLQQRAEKLQRSSQELWDRGQVVTDRFRYLTYLLRVLTDYAEMPGVALSLAQPRRLWGMDEDTCRIVFEELVRTAYLRQTRDGRFVRTA